MSEQTKCKCGSTMFWRNYPARGVWQEVVESNPNGGFEVLESTTDGLKQGYKEPKYLLCGACRKRVPNPNYKGT